MKKYLKILTLLSVLVLTSAKVFANDDPGFTVYVSENGDLYYEYPAPNKHRTPTRRILCTINKDGVYIPSVTTDEILSYDIYNTKGGCIASFATEADFISFIYNYKGTIEIRLYTETSVYHGFLTI